ncbi:MAG: hypothetical protein IPN71_19695 [Fibrobacteres bacterium]|nr:hypothetical protein [Fibrobacterota bacterium]
MQTETPISYWLPVDDHLALGAQPDQAGIDWLVSQGYTLVVNLNTPTARNFWPGEAAHVQHSNMHYVHYPLDCSELTPEKYELLRGVLASHRQGKVFLHCAMNVKSSGMAHIWRVKELGEDPVEARASLARTPGHEPKWENYWQKMGA